MNEAIVLNNNAIIYLQTGNAFEACNLLTQASTLYLQMTGDDCGRKYRNKHREHRIDWADLSNGRFSKSPMCCDDDDRQDCAVRPTLYKAGLTICKCCCQRSFSTEPTSCYGCFDDRSVCPCILAPVIWYNLGLTCQILAAEFGVHTTDGMFYLKRSSYLYDKVIKLYSKKGAHSKSLSTLYMAVLNNHACIHYEMGSIVECWHAMEKLQTALQAASRVVVRRPEWSIFYTNTLMLEYSGPSTASAA